MATWHYSSLGIPIAALGADHVTIGGYTDAITVDSADRLRGWVGAVAAAAGLDAAEIAGQARRAIAECERALKRKDFWALSTVPLPAELAPLDATWLVYRSWTHSSTRCRQTQDGLLTWLESSCLR
ncbi:hypothetical protein [Micromonospora sonneratiae]|uniref:Uncharacterized protein n=1 Tax=Micromonospora sonneratiae TaxID=1184706 RepID=A0ABW3Y812_9ACTN